MRKYKWARSVACITMLLLLAACASSTAAGSSSTTAGSSGASGLPSSVTLYSITDLTGSQGSSGQSVINGQNLAVSQINATHFLGSTQLSITTGDGASTPSTAASLATAAVSKDYPIILGPILSEEDSTAMPIIARAGIPDICIQCGGPASSVLLNNHIFRFTVLQTTRTVLVLKYLQSKGIHSLAVLELSDAPTSVDIAQAYQTQGPAYGVTVPNSDIVAISGTTVDTSAAAAKLNSLHAGAIVLADSSTQVASTITQLKQLGSTAVVASIDSVSTGILGTVGAAGNGVLWPADFFPAAASTLGAASVSFVSDYMAKYGKAPDNFAAEAFDSVWFAARGLKLANSTSHAAVGAALINVGKTGFNGALGHDTVVNGQLSTPSTGVLGIWESTQFVVG